MTGADLSKYDWRRRYSITTSASIGVIYSVTQNSQLDLMGMGKEKKGWERIQKGGEGRGKGKGRKN